MFSVKDQKNHTEAIDYNLFSLTCLYKYLSLQTIPTNLKVGSAAMFHKTIELTSSQMLFGYKVFGLIPNLAKSHFINLAKWLSVVYELSGCGFESS